MSSLHANRPSHFASFCPRNPKDTQDVDFLQPELESQTARKEQSSRQVEPPTTLTKHACDKLALGGTVHALHSHAHADSLRNLRCNLVESMSVGKLRPRDGEHRDSQGGKRVAPFRVVSDLGRRRVKHVAIVFDGETSFRPQQVAPELPSKRDPPIRPRNVNCSVELGRRQPVPAFRIRHRQHHGKRRFHRRRRPRQNEPQCIRRSSRAGKLALRGKRSELPMRRERQSRAKSLIARRGKTIGPGDFKSQFHQLDKLGLERGSHESKRRRTRIGIFCQADKCAFRNGLSENATGNVPSAATFRRRRNDKTGGAALRKRFSGTRKFYRMRATPLEFPRIALRWA